MNPQDFQSLLEQLRARLPDFDLFEATYFLRFTQRELAERLGISERMVRRRLKRVRERIARMLPEDFSA